MNKLFSNCGWEGNVDLYNINVKALGNYAPSEKQGFQPVDTTSAPKQNEHESMTSGWLAQSGLINSDIFKAYIPWYYGKPPFGFPRRINPYQLRLFAKNPYIFSVTKTIADEIAHLPFEIRVKEDHAAEGAVEDKASIKEIAQFFQYPNDNPFEDFTTIRKQWVIDLCEIGNISCVKIFNLKGQFRMIKNYDPATFLLNPDLHGMISSRDDFVAKNTPLYAPVIETEKNESAQSLIDKYMQKVNAEPSATGYTDAAAYFQYGWTVGAIVPFGKREVMWVNYNPRTDDIYSLSPIEILFNTILTLVYGGDYNLDFYLHNNLPNGILVQEGATEKQAQTTKNQIAERIMEQDQYGIVKKQHFNIPVTNNKLEFIPMQMTSKEMEVIEQQKWFYRVLLACFGLSENEMGITENVNLANSLSQDKGLMRKVIKPFVQMLEEGINRQIMPEFGHPELEFKFKLYDLEADKVKHDILEQELRMGVKTPEMVARELGIDVQELQKSRQSMVQQENQAWGGDQNEFHKEKKEHPEFSDKQVEQIVQDHKNGSQDANKSNEGSSADGEQTDKKKDKPEIKSVRPLKDSELQKNMLEKFLKDELNRVYDIAIRDLNNISNLQLTQFKGGYYDRKSKIEDAFTNLSTQFTSQRMRDVIRQFIKKYVFMGAEAFERDVAKQNILGKKISTNKFLSFTEVRTIYDNLVQTVTEIGERLSNQLRKSILTGAINGETMPKLKDRVDAVFEKEHKYVEGMTKTEASVIYGQGEFITARESGLNMRKFWLAHLDNKTTPICRELHSKYGTPAQSIKMDDKFRWDVNGGGACLASPAHYNCRSALGWIGEKEWEKKK